jgi:ketosteroid isomerase-like protein
MFGHNNFFGESNMTHSIRFIACLIVAACVATATGQDKPDTLDTKTASEAIPALTQQLLNALPGDAAVWRRYLSDRVVYVSETGEVANKKELLEAFQPFPPGITGSIEVRNVLVTEFGDTAIAVFDAYEKQTVYDQRIEVNYRATHAWQRENGRWRLIAAQNVVLAKDPKALPIDARQLADYVGTYELSGKRRYRVEQRGDTLVGGRENAELTPLIPLGENVFVEGGSNLGILRIFVRGRGGAVERLVQRRKFADLNWIKLPTPPNR